MIKSLFGSSSSGQEPNLLERLKAGIQKTRAGLVGKVEDLVSGKKQIDADLLEELEYTLISADIGVATATEILERIRQRVDRKLIGDASQLKGLIREHLLEILQAVERPVPRVAEPPAVVMVVGVNGAGKTTTIGKLAFRYKSEGRSVLLCAADTFRAAAIEQLAVWGERTGARVISRPVGSDAAGLAFDAMAEARRDNMDVLLVDTAGRLQNKKGLMEELEKIVRVLRKIDPAAPHQVLLVLDATTGQNAMSQVEVFREVAGVTGLVMTKLDGTARGGILVAISAKFKVPVVAIGVGERVSDLQAFDAGEFARAIARV